MWGLRHGRGQSRRSLWFPWVQAVLSCISWPKTEPSVLRVAFASLFFPTHVRPSPHPVAGDTESSLPWPLLTNCRPPPRPCTPTPTGRSCLRGGPGRASPLRPLLRCCPQTMPQLTGLSLPACSLSLPLPFTLLSHSGPLSVSARDLGCLPRVFAHLVPFATGVCSSPLLMSPPCWYCFREASPPSSLGQAPTSCSQTPVHYLRGMENHCGHYSHELLRLGICEVSFPYQLLTPSSLSSKCPSSRTLSLPMGSHTCRPVPPPSALTSLGCLLLRMGFPGQGPHPSWSLPGL